MRWIALGFLVMLIAGGTAPAHDNGVCPKRIVLLILGDGGAGSLWAVYYSLEFPPSWEWNYYLETGVLSGVQTGGNHALEPLVDHDHRCWWPVEAERDVLLWARAQ